MVTVLKNKLYLDAGKQKVTGARRAELSSRFRPETYYSYFSQDTCQFKQ